MMMTVVIKLLFFMDKPFAIILRYDHFSGRVCVLKRIEQRHIFMHRLLERLLIGVACSWFNYKNRGLACQLNIDLQNVGVAPKMAKLSRGRMIRQGD